MIPLSPSQLGTHHVTVFENMVATETNRNYCLATCSGTSAIHLALLALGVGPNDVVLCPTFTFIATANPIRYIGARIVFYDTESDMHEAIKLYKPKVVIIVQLYGDCFDYTDTITHCHSMGIPVLEDAAEALGATYNGKKAGSFGDVAILSFNLNKIITTGGGGAVVSNDKSLIDRCRFLATQARDNKDWYEHSITGYNYRMNVLAATYGITQLAQLAERIAERRAINGYYRECLPEHVFPVIKGDSTYWLTTIFCKDPAKVLQILKDNQVEARRMWKPLHTQPVFNNTSVFGGRESKYLFDHGLCLPSVDISRRDVAWICSLIRHEL